MLVRSVTLARFIACVAIAMAAFAAGSPPRTSAGAFTVPWYVQSVPDAPTETWLHESSTLTTGPVAVVVHINVPPLAAVGKHWSHQQRLAHVASIRAAQDALAPHIEALGGVIRGRFTHASAGVGALIDASSLDQLDSLSGVLDVRAVADYHIELSETPAFIGARDVAGLGVTGTGIDVAIIDSGVDYTHVKLGGPGTSAAYAAAYCGDASATPDPAAASCAAHRYADTTGLFGDPHYGRDGSPDNKIVGGHDWVGEVWPNADPRCAVAAGTSTVCPRDDPNPIDFQGHGTHVADIIGGREVNRRRKLMRASRPASISGHSRPAPRSRAAATASRCCLRSTTPSTWITPTPGHARPVSIHIAWRMIRPT